MIDMQDYKKKVEESAGFLQGRITKATRVVIILGTGLGSLIDSMDIAALLPYSEIPHFPQVTAPGHHGNLIFGTLCNKDVAVLQGRVHYYEGYTTKEITFPLRTLSLLGADTLITTNTAGGLNPDYRTGTIMVIRDHLNFIGDNPLRGENISTWGARFPDLSEPYDKKFISTALHCGDQLPRAHVTSGVYAAIPGPSLETPAETKFLRAAGADAVGMSSVPEVIVARHASMRVLGLSVVANINDPDNFTPILEDEVCKAAGEMQPVLHELIKKILTTIA